MKKVTSSILLFGLLLSCSQQVESLEKILPLQKINEKVAKENTCKLTVEINSTSPDQIDLKIESDLDDLLTPGKILSDYHSEVSNSSTLSFQVFTIADKNGRELCSMNAQELSAVAIRNWQSKSRLKKLVDDNFIAVYDKLDSTMTKNMTLETFKEQIDISDLNDMAFSGFMNQEGYQILGYSNAEIRITFTYMSEETGDCIIYGINIEQQ